jgi:hypothetical protein
MLGVRSGVHEVRNRLSRGVGELAKALSDGSSLARGTESLDDERRGSFAMLLRSGAVDKWGGLDQSDRVN